MTQADDYKVNLDVYSGPLELLLYLIKKAEVDIQDIPIAKITEQYLRHVDVISKIDINLAGEFLVMAATLMEIKSRMLIPRQPAAEGDEAAANASVEDLADPRAELVRQLLAYKAFKDAAADLKRRSQTEADRYPRAIGRPTTRAPLDIDDLNLFGLIDAFNAIMASIGHSAYGHEVVYDDTPISLHQADILDRLTREVQGGNVSGLTLQELFAGRTRKTEMIGLFLATLELIRQKKIMVDQPEPLGELRIMLREDAGDQMIFAEHAPTVAGPESTTAEAPAAAQPESPVEPSPETPAPPAPDQGIQEAQPPDEGPPADRPTGHTAADPAAPEPGER